MKLHGFHGNPLCDFKDWGMYLQNAHISAATDPKILNLVSNYFEDIALFFHGRICKLSNVNIHAV